MSTLCWSNARKRLGNKFTSCWKFSRRGAKICWRVSRPSPGKGTQQISAVKIFRIHTVNFGVLARSSHVSSHPQSRIFNSESTVCRCLMHSVLSTCSFFKRWKVFRYIWFYGDLLSDFQSVKLQIFALINNGVSERKRERKHIYGAPTQRLKKMREAFLCFHWSHQSGACLQKIYPPTKGGSTCSLRKSQRRKWGVW